MIENDRIHTINAIRDAGFQTGLESDHADLKVGVPKNTTAGSRGLDQAVPSGKIYVRTFSPRN